MARQKQNTDADAQVGPQATDAADAADVQPSVEPDGGFDQNADVEDVAKHVQQQINDSPVSGGDAFGATQDPSPALQAQFAAQVVSESGTVTDTPSANLSQEQLDFLNGRAARNA